MCKGQFFLGDEKTQDHILILDKDDPERELEFEIDFQLSLLDHKKKK